MSDGSIGGIGGVQGPQQSPVTAAPEEVQAKNPGYMNRKSISKLIKVFPFLAKLGSGRSEAAAKPLAEYKVTRQEGDVQNAVGQLKTPNKLSQKLETNGASIEKLQGGLGQFEKGAASKESNEWAVSQLKSELKDIGKLESSALSAAKSGQKKQTLAGVSQQPPEALTPGEVQAQKQLEEVRELKAEYKAVLEEALTLKVRFNKERAITKELETTLKGLESHLKGIDAKVGAKRSLTSSYAHQAKIGALKEAKSETDSLVKTLEKFDKKVGGAVHGAVPQTLSDRLTTLKESVAPKKQEISEKLEVSKKELKTAVESEKKAEKKQKADQKALSKSVGNLHKMEVRQGRQAQRSQKASVRQTKSASSTPTPERKTATSKASRSPEPVRKSSRRTSTPPPSAQPKSPKASGRTIPGALTSLALIKQLKGVRGTTTNFEDLRIRFRLGVGSVKELKQIIADRQASKITVTEQRRYVGLLKTTFENIAKHPEMVKQLDPDLVRAALDFDPGEASKIVRTMQRTEEARINKSR